MAGHADDHAFGIAVDSADAGFSGVHDGVLASGLAFVCLVHPADFAEDAEDGIAVAVRVVGFDFHVWGLLVCTIVYWSMRIL